MAALSLGRVRLAGLAALALLAAAAPRAAAGDPLQPLTYATFSGNRTGWPTGSASVQQLRAALESSFTVTYLDLESLLDPRLRDVNILMINAWEVAPRACEVDAAADFARCGGTLLLNANPGATANLWLAPFALETGSGLDCAARTYAVAASDEPIVAGPAGTVASLTNRCDGTLRGAGGGSFGAGGALPLAFTSASPPAPVLALVPRSATRAGQVLVVTNFHVFTDPENEAGGFMDLDESRKLLLNLAASAAQTRCAAPPAAPEAAPAGAGLNVVSNFDAMPGAASEGGWSYDASGGPGEASLYSTSEGILRQRTAALGGAWSEWSRLDAHLLDPALDLVVRARVRLHSVSGTFGVAVVVRHKGRDYSLSLLGDGAVVYTAYPSTFDKIPVDTSVFHTYEVRVPADSTLASVSVDGVLALTSPGGGGGAWADQIAFGDNTGADNGASADWDFVAILQGEVPCATPAAPPANLLANPGAEGPGIAPWTTGCAMPFARVAGPLALAGTGAAIDPPEGSALFGAAGPASCCSFGNEGYVEQVVDVSAGLGARRLAVYGGDAFALSARNPPALSSNAFFTLFFLDAALTEVGHDGRLTLTDTYLGGALDRQESPELDPGYRRLAIVPAETAFIRFRATANDGTNSLTAHGFDGLFLALEGGCPDPDEPPVAIASAPASVECAGGATEATLDGTASFDPDGDALAYSWKAGGVEVSTAAAPTLALPLGTYTFELTVTDPGGRSASALVGVTVADTTAPAILCPPSATGTRSGALVRFDATASDACGAPSVSLSVSADQPLAPGDVAISGGTVHLRDARTASLHGTRTYVVTARATDPSGNASACSFTFTVPFSGSAANEGVGNGADGNTPGHARNGGNDDPGNAPGRPGARRK